MTRTGPMDMARLCARTDTDLKGPLRMVPWSRVRCSTYPEPSTNGSLVKGKMFDLSGALYEGEWSRGWPHGMGTAFEPDGRVITGRWEKGLFCDGTVTCPDGRVIKVFPSPLYHFYPSPLFFYPVPPHICYDANPTMSYLLTPERPLTPERSLDGCVSEEPSSQTRAGCESISNPVPAPRILTSS